MPIDLEIRKHLAELAQISRWLRKERELSFYGDIDFIPTEEYTIEDANEAIYGAKKTVEIATKLIPLYITTTSSSSK
jgi:HEPN domain-containing protein